MAKTNSKVLILSLPYNSPIIHGLLSFQNPKKQSFQSLCVSKCCKPFSFMVLQGGLLLLSTNPLQVASKVYFKRGVQDKKCGVQD